MSRGFVKEDDQEETPIVPPRAETEGVVNYVTQGGMDELLNEKQELISEKRIWKLPMKMKGDLH
jgi:transcription elongation factor GreB